MVNFRSFLLRPLLKVSAVLCDPKYLLSIKNHHIIIIHSSHHIRITLNSLKQLQLVVAIGDVIN